jgi:putative membrane protein
MDFLINLLISAAVVFGLAYVMPQVHVKSFTTALWVALLLAVLNATVGFLIRLPLNIVTLGLLSFFVRLFVTAFVIKLVDKLVRNFRVEGWWPAFVIAIVLAIASTFTDSRTRDEYRDAHLQQKAPVEQLYAKQ